MRSAIRGAHEHICRNDICGRRARPRDVLRAARSEQRQQRLCAQGERKIPGLRHESRRARVAVHTDGRDGSRSTARARRARAPEGVWTLDTWRGLESTSFFNEGRPLGLFALKKGAARPMRLPQKTRRPPLGKAFQKIAEKMPFFTAPGGVTFPLGGSGFGVDPPCPHPVHLTLESLWHT